MTFRPSVLLALAFLAQVSAAQDLATVAKKEKERRAQIAAARAGKGAKQPSKTESKAGPYTEEDAKTAKGNVIQVKSGVSSSGGAPDDERKPVLEDGAIPSSIATEALWRAAIEAASARCAKTESTIVSLESKIQALRDDREPNPKDAFDPSRLQKRSAEMTNLQNQVDAARSSLGKCRVEVDGIRDKAHRLGVPAAWLR